MALFENPGYCPTCTSEVVFVAHHSWLRDNYLCSKCGSIPRERALMQAIDSYFPNWQELVIHESSPIGRGASVRLGKESKNYIPSQFFPDLKPGSVRNGSRCENLEKLTFADGSIDLHISQDVMEHIFHPTRAFREIARTLRPGGAHIFTVPLVNKSKPSKLRARMNDKGEVVHLEPPQYHGNPLSKDGALVTVDWGFDICSYIFESCGLFTHVVHIDDMSKGIRAEYIEVLITIKPGEQTNKAVIP